MKAMRAAAVALFAASAVMAQSALAAPGQKFNEQANANASGCAPEEKFSSSPSKPCKAQNGTGQTGGNGSNAK